MMHTTRRLAHAAALTLCAITTTACSLSPSADFLTALAADQETVCLTVTTIYGSMRLYRSNAMNAAAACSQDALSLTPLNKP